MGRKEEDEEFFRREMRRYRFSREAGDLGNTLFVWAVVGIFGGLIIVWIIALIVAWS